VNEREVRRKLNESQKKEKGPDLIAPGWDQGRTDNQKIKKHHEDYLPLVLWGAGGKKNEYGTSR